MSEDSLLILSERKITLSGKKAIDKWLEGKQAWNKWVKENPQADISFENVDFSKVSSPYVFREYCFPNGKVDFSGARFGEGGVDFTLAKFGDGSINFTNVDFGKGDVDFSQATFGNGDICFGGVELRDGVISFAFTSIGNGEFDFRAAQLINSGLTFWFARFGKGDIRFNHTECEGSSVDFSGVLFNDGDVCFTGFKFKGEKITFQSANFGSGDLNFNDIKLECDLAVFTGVDSGDGNIYFSGAYFNCSYVLLNNVTFKGFAFFNDLTCSKSIERFSFNNSIFEKNLSFSCGDINCVPDLTNAKTNNQISLSNLNCKFKRKGYCFFRKVEDTNDIARLRRLKEIAENNKDHAAALRFHADEMRAKRWHEMGAGASLLDMLFSGLSNYGQSISRPFAALFSLMFAMAFYAVGYAVPLSLKPSDYSQWLSNMLSIEFPTWLNGFDLAISSALPFISSSRNVHSQAEKALQLHGILPDYFGAVSLVYGGLCFLFLFLIGLGLRNRFRI